MKNLSTSKRKKITEILSRALNREESIIFAYLYGSFITNSSFHDIDIFVYTYDIEDPFLYPINIKEHLYDAVTKAGIDSFIIDDFDVRIINDAPYDIVIDILREGKLLSDKEPDIRKDYIEHISNEYRINSFVLNEAYGEDR